MRATTRRGGAGAAVGTRKEKGAAGGVGSKSVSVVVSHAASAAQVPSWTKSLASASAPVPDFRDAEDAPTVDALLWQLRELEHGVRALGVRERGRGGQEARWHRGRPSAARRRRLEEESVAVVKETADPRGEFRRSMAQMVAEKEINGRAELRELLQRFLSLNSAQHHHLILLAFADVWEELFSGAGGRRPAADHSTNPSPLRADMLTMVP